MNKLQINQEYNQKDEDKYGMQVMQLINLNNLNSIFSGSVKRVLNLFNNPLLPNINIHFFRSSLCKNFYSTVEDTLFNYCELL